MTQQEEAFDQLWAEMTATRLICLQMFNFFKMMTPNDPAWLDKQRFMLHQFAEASKIEGHPDQAAFKRKVKAAIDAAINAVRAAQTLDPNRPAN